ncbi:MAG: BolA family protein [Rhodothalassiaceae bacterium]
MAQGQVQATMRQKLQAAFQPTKLLIQDDSSKHAGHGGYKGDDAETHFSITIAAPGFADMSRVDRQRAVYRVLAEELAGPVHALALTVEAV